MCKVIAIANQKGGVGKKTTTSNLGIELSGLEVMLVNVMNRERVLQQYIELVKEQYDYVLIDCMPSLGMLTINAFACADSILIPVQAAYLPIKGLQQLMRTIEKVKRQINPKL